MNEFVNANNWYLLASPHGNVAPSPRVASTTGPMDLSSPVSTDEFDIIDMEPVAGRGKVVVVDDEGPKKYSPEETLWLARNLVNVSEDPVIGNQQSDKVFWEQIARKYNAGRPRGTFERSYGSIGVEFRGR